MKIKDLIPNNPLSAPEESRLALVGTPEAREELVLRSLKPALRFVHMVCRGSLPPEEMLSIAGVTLMRIVESYDPVRGRLINYARKFLAGAVAQAWRDRDPVSFGDEIPDKESEPDREQIEELLEGQVEPAWNQIDCNERMEVVRPYIDRLSDDETTVLVLTYESGFTYAATARLTGLSRSMIHRRHDEALRKIRNWMMDDGAFAKYRHK